MSVAASSGGSGIYYLSDAKHERNDCEGAILSDPI
jgi:hypothetical protein